MRYSQISFPWTSNSASHEGVPADHLILCLLAYLKAKLIWQIRSLQRIAPVQGQCIKSVTAAQHDDTHGHPAAARCALQAFCHPLSRDVDALGLRVDGIKGQIFECAPEIAGYSIVGPAQGLPNPLRFADADYRASDKRLPQRKLKCQGPRRHVVFCTDGFDPLDGGKSGVVHNLIRDAFHLVAALGENTTRIGGRVEYGISFLPGAGEDALSRAADGMPGRADCQPRLQPRW